MLLDIGVYQILFSNSGELRGTPGNSGGNRCGALWPRLNLLILTPPIGPRVPTWPVKRGSPRRPLSLQTHVISLGSCMFLRFLAILFNIYEFSSFLIQMVIFVVNLAFRLFVWCICVFRLPASSLQQIAKLSRRGIRPATGSI